MGTSFIELFSEKRDEIEIWITAQITETNSLQIDGIDFGELVFQLKGEREYEYHLTVRDADKSILINHLQDTGTTIDDDDDLLSWLKSNFSGNTGFSAFSKYLDTHNIKYETFFWK